MNYVDWLCYLSCLTYVLLPIESKNGEGTKLFLVFLMVQLFFRMYSLLSLFNFFSSKIQIINRIIINVIPFSLIVLFFYASTAFLMVFVDTKGTFSIEYFRDVYYWVIFGGFDDGAFAERFSVIPVVFGTIMVGVLLLNILIAYLSNEFSRLEEQQVISGWKTKASMNLKLELIAFFFKNGFKRVNNIVDSETIKYDHIKKAYNEKEAYFSEHKRVTKPLTLFISPRS